MVLNGAPSTSSIADRDSRAPDGDLCSRIIRLALEEGLVLVSAGPTRDALHADARARGMELIEPPMTLE